MEFEIPEKYKGNFSLDFNAGGLSRYYSNVNEQFMDLVHTVEHKIASGEIPLEPTSPEGLDMLVLWEIAKAEKDESINPFSVVRAKPL